ncbi:hypothetical protein R1flu_022029 [Riccia fluitans]|uniref:Uncharacterized protein n=1 Tax=Riccia fluitans TaxID=41844 RepID=A0ABD1ZSL8_9MARC
MTTKIMMKDFPVHSFFILWLLISCCSSKLQPLSFGSELCLEAANCGTSEQVDQLQVPAASSFLYSQILEPKREDGIDVLFYFVCGAFIEPERYLSFLTTLQAKDQALRLWIAIMKSPPSLDSQLMDSSVDEALAKVQNLGFPNNGSLFMGGHSIGAIAAGEVASKRALGLILIGASRRVGNDLLQYPLPVLTIIGERDGQMGYPSAALDTFQIANVEAEYKAEHTYYYKPVVTIPGMNHAQCYDGENPNFTRGDLVAETTVEQAHSETAIAIAAFLTIINTGIASKSVLSLQSRAVLEGKVDVNRMKKLIFGKALGTESYGAKEMQVQVAEGSSLTVQNVTVVHHDLIDNFNYSRPVVIGGRIVVPIYTQPLPRSSNTLYNLWVKFRSREAVLENYDVISDSKYADPVSTARQFNEKTFRKALHLASDEDKKKYLEEGLQIRFVEDLVLESSHKWDESDVVISPSVEDDRLYECRSPVYQSGEGLSMKLISIGRAMNWIYEDSFRLYQKY